MADIEGTTTPQVDSEPTVVLRSVMLHGIGKLDEYKAIVESQMIDKARVDEVQNLIDSMDPGGYDYAVLLSNLQRDGVMQVGGYIKIVEFLHRVTKESGIPIVVVEQPKAAASTSSGSSGTRAPSAPKKKDDMTVELGPAYMIEIDGQKIKSSGFGYPINTKYDVAGLWDGKPQRDKDTVKLFSGMIGVEKTVEEWTEIVRTFSAPKHLMFQIKYLANGEYSKWGFYLKQTSPGKYAIVELSLPEPAATPAS